MIRSLHIDDQATWRGGEQQVYYLLRGLKERGQEAELAAQPGSVLGERAQALGVKVHPVRMRSEGDVFAARRIARIIRSAGYDIVHMHTAHAHALGCMACAFNRTSVCVVSRRVDFSIRKHPLGLSRLKYRFRVDHFIAISNAVKEVLVNGGVLPDKISVVHSGVEPPRQDKSVPDIRSEFGLSSTARIIGTVGALVDHKGYRYLVEAAPIILKEMPEAKFILIGEGELRADLERRAQRQGVKNGIIFAGFRREAHAFLKQFDVFVAPSHMEGLNTSILDAMMATRPTVATTAGGIPEIVTNGETGLLVPPRDPAALAEAILDVLGNPEKAERLALAGQKRVMAGFTAERMVEGTIEVYKELLGGGNRA